MNADLTSKSDNILSEELAELEWPNRPAESKGRCIDRNKHVFVISDLHIGDRSPSDNLCRANREQLLDSFLRHVEKRKGQLIVVGDLFELWRYSLDSIISRRKALLDRLAGMDAVYVPGNHDKDVMQLSGTQDVPHPFFVNMSHAFVRTIGSKRFKFMHGHEVDPFASDRIQNLGRMVGHFAVLCQFGQGACILSNDAVSDALEEAGEYLLHVWNWLTRGMNQALREGYGELTAGRMRCLTRRIRTQRMLARYHRDRADGLYDVAIVGHTHKEGRFGDWYFNSGSWTGSTNNFLKISPDGDVGVFDWTDGGPRPKNVAAA